MKQSNKKITNIDQVAQTDGLQWRIHTGNFFELIMESSDNTWILRKGLQVFRQYMIQVGEEAIRLDDHKLNQLMIRLGVYTVSQPDHPDYNKDIVAHILNAKEKDYTLSK